MNNFVQPGKTLTLAAPYNRLAGQGAKVGTIFGVAVADVLNGVNGEFDTEGVYDIDKVDAQAWAQGDKIYWDDSAKAATNVSTAGMFIGVATRIEANPTATGNVKLAGGGSAELAEGAQSAIVVLTDNSGVSGSHDDTIADGLTATAPASITEYTPHSAGATPVTSAAATDLDTTAAALNTLVDEVQALQVTVAACVTDLAVQNQNDSDLAQKVIEIRAALVTAGILLP